MVHIRKFLFIILLFASCSRFEHQEALTSSNNQEANRPFFVSMPIAHYSKAGIPCLEVGIEGDLFCMKMDLGFSGNLYLESAFAEQIQNKTLVEEGFTVGLLGTAYSSKRYKLPEVSIGKGRFFDVHLDDDGGASQRDSVLIACDQSKESQPHGSIGWLSFVHTNLLLDLPNDVIAFSDSIHSLEGYDPDVFQEVEIDLGEFISFEMDVAGQRLTCILDTGATYSILNTELPEGTCLKERVLEESSYVKKAVNIGGVDVGEVEFLQIPIQYPTRIDALLGMNFIQEHAVFIDFARSRMYLRKD